ncbi:MAG: UvrB/UvrC motif-containing protein [Phycisphaeraceae bacterium]|nr:UvrB/UvrC motif-containing protein [Phycisphaeraceae bacterium]
MNRDLTTLLDEWPYEPGQLNVRLIDGKNGEQLIQIRLDLGILQLRMDGRPDGVRPEGFASLLDMYETRLDELEHESEEEEAETAEEFTLSEEDCRALREEAVQFYHRYMACLALEDYDAVVRDTSRNLRVIDLCSRYAVTERDRTELEQYRPYILMIRSRALASAALRDNEPKAAVLAIDEGLEALRQYFAERGEPGVFEQAGEVQMLRSMRSALVPKLPVSQKSELRQRLQDAIARENYELAAILRDELRLLGDEGASPGLRRPSA